MKQGIVVHNKDIHHLYFMEPFPKLEVVLCPVQTTSAQWTSETKSQNPVFCIRLLFMG